MGAGSATKWLEDLRERAVAELAAGRLALGEHSTRALFSSVLPFGAYSACVSLDDVGPAADEIGYPVVVKALSDEVLHKSDHGLVEVGVTGPLEAVAAARATLDRLRAVAPKADVTFAVQRQLSGIEIAIGIRRDPLGALCLVGAGGRLVELLADTAVAMAPLSTDEARGLLRKLRIWPLLAGFRGDPAVDVDQLLDLMVRASLVADAVPEIAELDLNPVFATSDGVAIADARCLLTEPPPPERDAQPDPGRALAALFAPRRIAVVGASSDSTKVGGLALRYLTESDPAAEIVAVNPKPVNVPGASSASALAEIEGTVDLALIAVPGPMVEDVVRECVQADVPAGIVFTAGFAETGAAGVEAERRLLDAAGQRFRFVGPNSIGVASPARRLFATFGMGVEGDGIQAGSIALVSQSGAIASSLVSRGAEYGIGFSHWVSTGNEADLGAADYLEFLAEDPETKIVCLFLEAVRRPQAFRRACERIRAAGKPLVALKAGRSETGQAAAVSHTGALTGSAIAYEAFLNACGVLVVRSLGNLFSALRGLAAVGAVRGERAAILSMSGGLCSVLADACTDVGIAVPELDAGTQKRLRAVIPRYGATSNPVDITVAGIRSPQMVGEVLEAVRQAPGIDVVLLQLSTNADPAAERMAKDLIAARNGPGAPFLLGRLGAAHLAPRAVAAYEEASLPVFAWPEELIEAAQACIAYGRLQGAAT